LSELIPRYALAPPSVCGRFILSAVPERAPLVQRFVDSFAHAWFVTDRNRRAIDQRANYLVTDVRTAIPQIGMTAEGENVAFGTCSDARPDQSRFDRRESGNGITQGAELPWRSATGGRLSSKSFDVARHRALREAPIERVSPARPRPQGGL
jgi:hypothetical protein